MSAERSSAPGSVEKRPIWHAIGPGILFAGAAVGVSHLVQSTRAGAEYGLALVVFVVLANIVKYPAFRFGPQYSAATGVSLLEGYRRQGSWALIVYAVLTVGTMFTVQAAVSIVTAGLAVALLGLHASPITVAAVLVAICAVLLGVGQYQWLDRISKVVVVVLTLSTLAATVLALPKLDWAGAHWLPAGAFFTSHRDIFFLAALVGWMPSAIDVAAWQSLWTLARARDSGQRPTIRESLFDFHLGYVGTAILAICFVTLGAAVMHGSGQSFAPTAGGFAAQVIELYAQTLGGWSRPIIGTCAFAVMFSTTLTVVDGFPRAIAVLVQRLRSAESPDAPATGEEQRHAYWVSLVVIGVGSILVLIWLLESLARLVDLATTLSFLTAPILAWLNHRAMLGEEVPPEARPSSVMGLFSLVCVVILAAFALYYLYLRFAVGG